MTATSRPDDTASISDAGIALLFGAFSHLCAQRDLAGLLRVTAGSGQRFGMPWHIGCLLRDDATDAWYLTALLEPTGRPVDLMRLHIPSGPFPFHPPEGPEAKPLTALLSASWGDEACRMIAQQLGGMALCAPISTGNGTQGALLALTAEQTIPPLLQGIFVHAAIAAAHQITPSAVAANNSVLAPETLVQRAEAELARAQRYHRSLSVVTVLLPKEHEMAPAATTIARAVRSWDFVGRLDWHRPLAIDSAWPRFAVILPETKEDGARGLVRRLKADLPDCWFGTAGFPEDGGSFASLVERACHSATRLSRNGASITTDAAAVDPAGPRPGRVWRR